MSIRNDQGTPVFLWLGTPDVGSDHLLMVMTGDDGASVYRPLLFLNETAARESEPTAQNAANALGVVATLREYRLHSTISTVNPQEAPTS